MSPNVPFSPHTHFDPTFIQTCTSVITKTRSEPQSMIQVFKDCNFTFNTLLYLPLRVPFPERRRKLNLCPLVTSPPPRADELRMSTVLCEALTGASAVPIDTCPQQEFWVPPGPLGFSERRGSSHGGVVGTILGSTVYAIDFLSFLCLWNPKSRKVSFLSAFLLVHLLCDTVSPERTTPQMGTMVMGWKESLEEGSKE